MRIYTASVLALSVASSDATTPATQNANHIFNALHSSMRQWGSSVLHNGMSAFIATVPQGTQLYHGTDKPERVNTTEWLAFEPEHALVFAHPRSRGPPGSGRPHGPGDENKGWHPPQSIEPAYEYPLESPKHELKARHSDDDRPLSHDMAPRERGRIHHQQEHIDHDKSKSNNEQHGYLHTYRAKHDLRLLYLDGQSAAKSAKGTLDMQDLVLLHSNPPPADPGPHQPQGRRKARGKDQPSRTGKPRHGGPMGEGYRAEHLCAMAENEWEGKIDGFLRMEMGFEIILCSFERDLDVDRVTQAKASNRGGGLGHGDDSINYYRVVASRFDGIGGDRVTIDYENFVTLYTYPSAVYFDQHDLPRVNNDTQVLAPGRTAIKEMALRPHTSSTTNWQALADMVVVRYSDRIATLAAANFSSQQAFQTELEAALQPFIDYGNRNTSLELERCATHYLPFPPLLSNCTAAQAILDVSTHLCAELLTATTEKYSEAVERVQALKAWLGWTTFKRCRGCGYDEVCFTPIWPMGGKEFFERPRCVASMKGIGSDHWGGWMHGEKGAGAN